jgi:hypothetical protein
MASDFGCSQAQHRPQSTKDDRCPEHKIDEESGPDDVTGDNDLVMATEAEVVIEELNRDKVLVFS